VTAKGDRMRYNPATENKLSEKFVLGVN